MRQLHDEPYHAVSLGCVMEQDKSRYREAKREGERHGINKMRKRYSRPQDTNGAIGKKKQPPRTHQTVPKTFAFPISVLSPNPQPLYEFI